MFVKIRQKIVQKCWYLLYWIHHKKFDHYTDIYSLNPLYLIIHRGSGCFKEKTGNKYLAFASTNKKKH